jgi:Domain of unknown function (DUF222)
MFFVLRARESPVAIHVRQRTAPQGSTEIRIRTLKSRSRIFEHLSEKRSVVICYVERGRTERKHRRVSLRPAPDTMSFLSGYLPVEQGVACIKALQDHTNSVKASGDQRSRNQILADTFVERLTGQAETTDVNAELQIVMDLDALLDANNHKPAELAGYGPLPAGLARDIFATSKGRLWWRRLDASPVGGPLAGRSTPHHQDQHANRAQLSEPSTLAALRGEIALIPSHRMVLWHLHEHDPHSVRIRDPHLHQPPRL